MNGYLRLVIELTRQGAERLEDMRSRLGAKAKFADLTKNALGLYEALDGAMESGDTLWIKRGNNFIEVTDSLLPDRPPTRTSPTSTPPKKIQTPPGWKVFEGDKE